MINTANITQNIVKANIEIDWHGRMVILKLERNTYIGVHYSEDPNQQRVDIISWMDIHAATLSIFKSAEEHEPDQKLPPFPFQIRTEDQISLNPDWKLLIKHMP